MAWFITWNTEDEMRFYLYWREKNEFKHIYCGKLYDICGGLNTVFLPTDEYQHTMGEVSVEMDPGLKAVRDPSIANEILKNEGSRSLVNKLSNAFEGVRVSSVCYDLGFPAYTSEKISGVTSFEKIIEFYQSDQQTLQQTLAEPNHSLDPVSYFLNEGPPPFPSPDEESRGQLQIRKISEKDQDTKPNQSTSTRDYDPHKEKVKELYMYQCVFCEKRVESPESGGGNYEVEAAHIQADSDDGPDIPENRIALCTFHHWAFDNGWLSITDDYKILVKDVPECEGYTEFIHLDGKQIVLPDDESAYPHPHFLQIHREKNGFTDE